MAHNSNEFVARLNEEFLVKALTNIQPWLIAINFLEVAS